MELGGERYTPLMAVIPPDHSVTHRSIDRRSADKGAAIVAMHTGWAGFVSAPGNELKSVIRNIWTLCRRV
jgi:hypothetical protein